MMPGSKINISETAVPSVPSGFYARPDDSENGLDDISDAISARSAPSGPEYTAASDLQIPEAGAQTMPGMDQIADNGYNEKGRKPEPRSGRSMSSDSGYDVLPDLESLAGAFLTAGGKNDEVFDYQDPDAPKRQTLGNKPQKMDVDFNAKELAAGIRTILRKEEG